MVEPRVTLDPHGRAGRSETSQRRAGLGAVALPLLHLGRVDLDEAHALAVRQDDGVAVDDVGDARELGGGGGGRRRHQQGESE